MKREKRRKLFDNLFLSVQYVDAFRQIIWVHTCMTAIDGIYMVVILLGDIDGFDR